MRETDATDATDAGDNGVFLLKDASPEVLRAIDYALCKTFPHNMTNVFQENGRWYDTAVMAPSSAKTPLVENCRWCHDAYPGGVACRRHPVLLRLLRGEAP